MFFFVIFGLQITQKIYFVYCSSRSGILEIQKIGNDVLSEPGMYCFHSVLLNTRIILILELCSNNEKQPKFNLSVLSITDFLNRPDKGGDKYVPKKVEKSFNRKS